MTVVAVGTLDPPEERLVEPSKRLVKRLREQGAGVKLVILEGMNHADTVLALGDERTTLFQAILRMIQAR
jgi:acetyl esterase/lipase